MSAARSEMKVEISNTQKTPATPLEEYAEKLKKYKEESKDMTSLEKHVFLFLDKNKTFSPATIATELNKMHGKSAETKGSVIAKFNGVHSGSYKFCPAAKKAYSQFLHLGTTRVWNADGTFNEDRWQQFVKFTTADQKEENKIVSLSSLKAYLEHCYKNDKEEKDTARKSFGLFSGRIQKFAASAAWDEAFDRLACGWQPLAKDPKNLEPYLTLEVAREFLEDSPVAFLKAECGLLPVPKPEKNQYTRKM